MPLLSVQGVTKTYPGVKALQNVSFGVERGTVHAVMGENGAGKSTLMQIIAGVQQPTEGTLVFEGKELHLSGTRDANHRGIAIVPEKQLRRCWNLLENVPKGLCASLQVDKNPRAVSFLVVRGSRIRVGHSKTQRVVEQSRDLAGRRGDGFGFADTRREPSIEGSKRRLRTPNGYRGEP